MLLFVQQHKLMQQPVETLQGWETIQTELVAESSTTMCIFSNAKGSPKAHMTFTVCNVQQIWRDIVF